MTFDAKDYMNDFRHLLLMVCLTLLPLSGCITGGTTVIDNPFVGKWSNETGTHIVEFTERGDYSYAMHHDTYPGTYHAPTNALEFGTHADALITEFGTNRMVVIEMSDERKRDGLWVAVAESHDTIVLVWTGCGIERLYRARNEKMSNKALQAIGAKARLQPER